MTDADDHVSPTSAKAFGRASGTPKDGCLGAGGGTRARHQGRPW